MNGWLRRWGLLAVGLVLMQRGRRMSNSQEPLGYETVLANQKDTPPWREGGALAGRPQKGTHRPSFPTRIIKRRVEEAESRSVSGSVSTFLDVFRSGGMRSDGIVISPKSNEDKEFFLRACVLSFTRASMV